MGGKLREDWLQLARPAVDRVDLSESDRLNLLFALFLEADMNSIGLGTLPPGLQVCHRISKLYIWSSGSSEKVKALQNL